MAKTERQRKSKPKAPPTEKKEAKTPAARLATVMQVLRENNIGPQGVPMQTPQGILIPRVQWIDLGTGVPIRHGAAAPTGGRD